MREEPKDPTYSTEITVGEVSVSVEGSNPEEVSDLAEQKLDVAVKEAERLGVYDQSSYHMEGGAGWLMAYGDADTPEEAYAMWLDMWERMIEDVKDLSDEERRQAGVSDNL